MNEQIMLMMVVLRQWEIQDHKVYVQWQDKQEKELLKIQANGSQKGCELTRKFS